MQTTLYPFSGCYFDGISHWGVDIGAKDAVDRLYSVTWAVVHHRFDCKRRHRNVTATQGLTRYSTQLTTEFSAELTTELRVHRAEYALPATESRAARKIERIKWS